MRHMDIYAPGMRPWQPLELANDQEDDDMRIEMSNAGDDAALAAALEGDYDRAADVFAGMAAAVDDDTDPVGELDRQLSDYTPHDMDEDTRARMQDTDRDEYAARGVPSTVVEMALPALYGASAKVRGQAEAILSRAEGADPGSDRYNFVMSALDDLLTGAGLRANAKAYSRARREDTPTVDELTAAWNERFAPPRRDDDGDTAKEYGRPVRRFF